MISLSDIQHARQRIQPDLCPTLLEPSTLGDSVWLKLENTNKTHSFKIRGALNAALALDNAARARGLVAASSGNHAQALSYAAQLVGAQATIFMPRATPQRKINGVKRYGAQPIVVDGTYDDAEAAARQFQADHDATFVSAYNDPHVVAGQGTIGLEILDQLPEVERVLVCVSGGGLLAGIAVAIKAQRPDVEVIGVGAEHAPAMYNRFHGTDHVEIEETLAEALSGDIEDGCITVPLVQSHVDNIVLVSEEAIAQAMRWCVLDAGWVVEGGGAVCVAALREGIIPINGRKTAALVSGGNVDGETLLKIMSE